MQAGNSETHADETSDIMRGAHVRVAKPLCKSPFVNRKRCARTVAIFASSKNATRRPRECSADFPCASRATRSRSFFWKEKETDEMTREYSREIVRFGEIRDYLLNRDIHAKQPLTIPLARHFFARVERRDVSKDDALDVA